MKKTQKHDQNDTPVDSQESAELTAAQKEIEAWKSKYMRALADYQNLERRNREEREEVRIYASELILGRMLPAIDTLRRAKDHLHDIGLDLAYKEFIAILDEKGVTKIETVGSEFDPHLMECIEVVDGQENTVVEETVPGYMLNGKVLRVAQVKVGKNSAPVNG